MRDPDLTGDVTDSPAFAWVQTGPRARPGRWERSSSTGETPSTRRCAGPWDLA